MTVPDSIGCLDTVAVHVTRSDYPPPPKAFKASADVETMWSRFQRYKQGKEPLPAMAYFCLDGFEKSAGVDKRKCSAAARRYEIAETILTKLSELTSTRGDEGDARKSKKAADKWKPLSATDVNWIEEAVKLLIRRKGEYDYDPAASLPKLTLNDLPKL